MNRVITPSWQRITRSRPSARRSSIRNISHDYLHRERWRDFAAECLLYLILAVIAGVTLVVSANDLLQFVGNKADGQNTWLFSREKKTRFEAPTSVA